MSGFNRNTPSLANGIPARHIGPETGSSGNATMTNTGGTSEGTNEAADSRPTGASGLEAPIDTGSGEERSFGAPRADIYRARNAEAPILSDVDETAAQQIADGGDHIKRESEHKKDR